jgi:hypothetical protein
MLKQKVRDFLAARLARWLRHFALDPRYFELWQAHGYHVQQVHFYNPLPDTRALPERTWKTVSELPGLELNEPAQLRLLDELQARFRSEYASLPAHKPPGPPRFYFGNGSFETGDAELLYCLVRQNRPQRVVEIGSGFTTLLAAQALARNAAEGAAATLTAIEPYPPAFLREALPVPVELVAEPVQNVPLERFTSLRAGDILFIDSSHVCKIGSDVQYEILEILPRLAPGVLVHLHDIFLPVEYPREWVMEWHRFWNEQYLLQAFLCGNRDFEVLWAGTWMHLRHPEKLAAAFPSYDPKTSWLGSFWIRRRQLPA